MVEFGAAVVCLGTLRGDFDQHLGISNRILEIIRGVSSAAGCEYVWIEISACLFHKKPKVAGIDGAATASGRAQIGYRVDTDSGVLACAPGHRVNLAIHVFTPLFGGA